ncbi:CD282 [Mytilus edulis]|uniref:TLR2 n=1 Tax=Mytilus edulis TaxID=6550 RepID=A0A8S3TIY6_MYTED|nr:CD282 [Mytilus edulis]
MDSIVVPGLFGLNLNLMYVLDIQMIDDEIEALESRLKIEHKCVHNVLNNMIAILKTKLPRLRCYAKENLEHILRENKNNLNALSDLEQIYKGLHRISDAERCKERIEKILNSTHEEDMVNKAVCLLEQGYALVHDMSANIENIASSKLTDAHKLLQAEHYKSEKERRKMLQKCVFHNKQAISNLEQSMQCSRTNEYFLRKITALQQFERAQIICSTYPYRIVWSYYIGEAWNRHVDSLQRQKTEHRKKDVLDASCKAIELFLNVANMTDAIDKKSTYISRSLAQIGNILIKRHKTLENNPTDFEFFQDESFVKYIKDPMIPLKKAYDMQKFMPDSFVMNKYGRALFHLSKETDSSDKQQRLQMALEILTRSTECFTMNWFAYSTRMQVAESLGDLHLTTNRKLSWQYFQGALSDGHQCFESKGSAIDMEILARICQKIAKFPYTNKYGAHAVKKKEFLHYALDYLQHGIALSGPSEYNIAKRMASCLYDLDELVTATEWMKRALSLCSYVKIYDCKITCLYLLKRYGIESKINGGDKPYYLLREIIYILLKCKKQQANTDEVYEYIIRTDYSDLCSLINDVVTVKQLLKQTGLAIITEILQCETAISKLDIGRQKQMEQFKEQIASVVPLDDIEMVLEEEFEQSSAPIPIPLETQLVPDGYQYSFFISHSNRDSDWVNNMLLFELEKKFSDEDEAFKGCIADRDFVPGKTIIKNITEAIRKSCKIILVLTKHFVASPWCENEMERALVRHINDKDSCVIPLLLEPLSDEQFPDCLKNITYLDMTDESTRIQEISRLKRALLYVPGDDIIYVRGDM